MASSKGTRGDDGAGDDGRGDGDAGDGGGDAGDGGAVVFAFASASLHFFDFFDLATPSGGFGVTSARHEERAANTPW